MEKRKALITAVLFLFTAAGLFGQSSPRKIRMNLWALQDAYPGSYTAETEEFQYAKRQIADLSSLLLSGMCYGWKFTYTPYDKTRNVPESFECTPIKTFDADAKNIWYEEPVFKQDKISVWVNFIRTPQMLKYYERWSAIKNPRVMGSGKGKLSAGFEGMTQAASAAVRNGIREYYRKVVKNKPKVITGTILIRKVPAIYIDSGNYVVDLDFFLETDKIVEYTQF